MGDHRPGGSRGWVDVAKKGFFAWEYKGKHGDVAKAYLQLQRYREMVENPPLLVVSDFATIMIHTNITNTPTQRYTLTLDDLLTPSGLRTLRAVFFDPYALYMFDEHHAGRSIAAPQLPRSAGRSIAAPQLPQSVDWATAAFADVLALFQVAYEDVERRHKLPGWEVRWFDREPVACQKSGEDFWRIPTGSKPFVKRLSKSAVQRYGTVWARRGWIIVGNDGKSTSNQLTPHGQARCICIRDTVLKTWQEEHAGTA
jgi:hypothetical protein